MPLWGRNDAASNSVKYAARLVNAGSGKAAIAANNTAMYGNVSASAFVANQVVGQFGVSLAEMANTDGESKKIAHPGWVLRRAGTGGVAAFTVDTPGEDYANGETFTVSNGVVNAVGVVTTDGNGAITSVAVQNPGAGWISSSHMVVESDEMLHLGEVLVADGGSGYDNTDVITVSNGTVNAVATPVTDGSGNIQSVSVTSVGLWANTKIDADAAITIANSSGGASGGTGADLAANLVTGDGTAVILATVGGRAGRVHYETLAAIGSITGDGNDDALLPE